MLLCGHTSNENVIKVDNYVGYVMNYSLHNTLDALGHRVLTVCALQKRGVAPSILNSTNTSACKVLSPSWSTVACFCGVGRSYGLSWFTALFQSLVWPLLPVGSFNSDTSDSPAPVSISMGMLWSSICMLIFNSRDCSPMQKWRDTKEVHFFLLWLAFIHFVYFVSCSPWRIPTGSWGGS